MSSISRIFRREIARQPDELAVIRVQRGAEAKIGPVATIYSPSAYVIDAAHARFEGAGDAPAPRAAAQLSQNSPRLSKLFNQALNNLSKLIFLVRAGDLYSHVLSGKGF